MPVAAVVAPSRHIDDSPVPTTFVALASAPPVTIVPPPAPIHFSVVSQTA